MRPRCAPAHLLRNVRVFPRLSRFLCFFELLFNPVRPIALRYGKPSRTTLPSFLLLYLVRWRRGESNPRPEKVAIQCLITRLVTDCKNAVCTVRVDRSQIPPLGLGPRTSSYHFLFQGMAPRDLGYHFVFANEFNSVLKSHG